MLPWVAFLGFYPSFDVGRPLHFFVCSFFSLLVLWISFTNQIHKWAHTYKPPAFIAFLQRWHIILESKGHQRHHSRPYDENYCITTGWLNPVLQRIDLWKRLEKVISYYTGALPRQDDAAWTDQLCSSTNESTTHEVK